MRHDRRTAARAAAALLRPRLRRVGRVAGARARAAGAGRRGLARLGGGRQARAARPTGGCGLAISPCGASRRASCRPTPSAGPVSSRAPARPCPWRPAATSPRGCSAAAHAAARGRCAPASGRWSWRWRAEGRWPAPSRARAWTCSSRAGAEDGAGRTFVALENVELLGLRAGGEEQAGGRGRRGRRGAHRARHAAGRCAPGGLSDRRGQPRRRGPSAGQATGRPPAGREPPS